LGNASAPNFPKITPTRRSLIDARKLRRMRERWWLKERRLGDVRSSINFMQTLCSFVKPFAVEHYMNDGGGRGLCADELPECDHEDLGRHQELHGAT